MREILFRGRRRDNREWVFGSCYKQTEFYGDKAEGIMIITSSESLCYDQALEYYAVSEETVGQFTGMTDKNGKKIFEGDVVRITDDEGNTDFSDGGIGAVEFFDGLWYVGGQVHNGLYDLHKCFFIEVIGNIHDQPELLETT